MPKMSEVPQPTAEPERDPEIVDLDEFASEFGVDLLDTLDVGTWKQGPDLEALNRRLSTEVAQAVAQEHEAVAFIRREVFPRLTKQVDAPAQAGVYQARPEDIDRALRNALFNGCVEACDGTVAEHDTLV